MNRKFVQFFIALLAAFILNGCAASSVQNVEESGFLSDYSQLSAGGEDRAVFLYVNPKTNFKQYDKIIFDRFSVVIKRMEKVVDQPCPGVLRARFAITDVKPSKPVANTLSTVLPVGWVVSGATKVVSDENVGTGQAAAEMELLDSMSGERLAAAVDRRQGGKKAFSGKWSDAQGAFDYWAKTFRQRLDQKPGM